MNKRDNVFPSLPITTLIHNTRIMHEVDQKIVEIKTQIEADFNGKLEKMKEVLEQELKVKLIKEIYNEVYEKILEEIRRHDGGWEKIEKNLVK